jgi:two-component system chemotaxis response regulator CheB
LLILKFAMGLYHESCIMNHIRVLIVDDSPFIRKALLRIFELEPTIEVVGAARDGKEAVEKVISLNPDVITLDIMMPVMDGIETLKIIMEIKPTPVLMLSQYTQEGAELTLNALEFGAMDFVDKSRTGLMDFSSLAKEIISKIKAIAGKKPLRIADLSTRKAIPLHPPLEKGGWGDLKEGEKDFQTKGIIDVVAIGTSTGGPPALQMLLPKFPKNISFGILIVQHMPVGFTEPLAKRLDSMCNIHVKEAEEGDEIQPGIALIAPSGMHMTVSHPPLNPLPSREGRREKDTLSKGERKDVRHPSNEETHHRGSSETVKSPLPLRERDRVRGDLKGEYKGVKLDIEPLNAVHRPSVDVLFKSVAENYGSRSMGVILTGMGSDGAKGMQMIKEQGGITLAQDEATSTIFGMPKVAVEKGVVDKIVPITSMAEEILKAV